MNKNRKTLIFLTILMLLAVFFTFLRKFNFTEYKIDQLDFIKEYLCLSVFILGFLVSLELELKSLNIGWILVMFSGFVNLLDEFKVLLLNANNLFSYVFKYCAVMEELFIIIGVIFTIYGIKKDSENKKEFLNKLEYNAYHDYLTGLVNRRYIIKLLNSLLEDGKGLGKKDKIAIIVIDLDNFKEINDTLGHRYGDEILKEVSQRLTEEVSDIITVGRLSGAEFIAVVDNGKYAKERVQEIVDIFSRVFVIFDKKIKMTVSMGISILYEDASDLDTLFTNADMAMCKAKEVYGNSYRVYDDIIFKEIIKKIEVIDNLEWAIHNKEFILHYQPKVSIVTGEIIGLEALIRMKDYDGKLIYPDKFIEIAEENKIITEIDERVLEMVLLQFQDWKRIGIDPVNIAINISAESFGNSKFISKLEQKLSAMDMPLSLITIEITETTAMKNIDYTKNIVEELKNKGISISLDDFGKAYSSLNYLKSFAIDTLKIDKCFTDGIGINDKAEAVIEVMVSLAKKIGMKILSEGVETSSQLEFLNKIGCDQYQGYFFSKPVDIKEIEKMMKRERGAICEKLEGVY